MTPEELDAYAVLGVEPDASQEELKLAHRRLVRRHHPDLAGPEERARATRRVQRVNMAYGLVRDPQTRAAYDRLRSRRGPRASASVRTDRTAAAAWQALVADAGRWAGRWWRLNRGRARRAAVRTTLRARRGTLELLSRLQVLALGLTGALAGMALALAAGRVANGATVVPQLVGLGAGWWVGSSRGRRRRLRLLGLPQPPAPAWLVPLGAAVALAAAVALDTTLA